MSKYSKDKLERLPPDLLRAAIRERTHNSLQLGVNEAVVYGVPVKARLGEDVRRLLEVWQERGLPTEGADLQWAQQLLEFADMLKAGERPSFGTEPIRPLAADELATVERLLFNRRSIRRWTDQAVPRWMLEKVVEAGLWAPHACNLQTIRAISIDDDDKDSQALFDRSATRGDKAKIVMCQDTRPYEYRGGIAERNRLFDCGAAIQNMLLMAHALGLGAVWLTFSPHLEDDVRTHYQLPDYIAVRAYIALGWPAESPLPLAPWPLGRRRCSA